MGGRLWFIRKFGLRRLLRYERVRLSGATFSWSEIPMTDAEEEAFQELYERLHPPTLVVTGLSGRPVPAREMSSRELNDLTTSAGIRSLVED